jgi:hypothetical protein
MKLFTWSNLGRDPVFGLQKNCRHFFCLIQFETNPPDIKAHEDRIPIQKP